MRVSERQIDKLAVSVAAALARQERVRLRSAEPAISERVKRVILENLEQEQALEDEAERMARQHAAQMRMTGMDQQKVIQGIKERLARERDFPL